MTCEILHEMSDKWQLRLYMWQVTCDMLWHVIYDMWYVTCDRWWVTSDEWVPRCKWQVMSEWQDASDKWIVTSDKTQGTRYKIKDTSDKLFHFLFAIEQEL